MTGSLEGRIAAACAGFVQHFSESPAEIGVAKRIEDRVESGIDVAQPQSDFEERVADAVRADGHDQEHYEVRQPADHEGADNDAQLPSSFSFFLRNQHRWSGGGSR